MDIEQLLKEGPSLTLNPEEEFSDLVVKEPQKEEVQEEKAYEEEKISDRCGEKTGGRLCQRD